MSLKAINQSVFEMRRGVFSTGKKGKAIPVTGREGPKGRETSRIPHFVYIISSQMTAALYPPGRFLVLISVKG
jgi:nicotinamide mononucleotide (NMN) deamidase PncC